MPHREESRTKAIMHAETRSMSRRMGFGVIARDLAIVASIALLIALAL